MGIAAVPDLFRAPLPGHLDRAAVRVRVDRLAGRLAVVALLSVAGGLRVSHLGASGFAEDEMDKLAAGEAYLAGDFSIDGEHPALMKWAVAGSLLATDAWNARALPQTRISRETAVRLPNALAGTLTSLALLLLGRELFGSSVGWLASWFWAVDVRAISINRVAKEDTFALLFLLLGAWLYERAKAHGRQGRTDLQWWFAGAGVMFGLMLGSKYMPYLFGIHVLYFRCADPHPGSNRANPLLYLGALASTFALVNFPVWLPDNWRTIADFLSGGAILHSGYVFQGRVWENAMSATPGGLPVWFYGTALLTKTPLVTLVITAVGLIRLWRSPPTRGRTFVWVFLLLTLVPYSLAGTKFVRYMLPTFAVLDLAAAVGVAWMVEHAVSAARTPPRAVVRVLSAAVLTAPFLTAVAVHPLPSLFRNMGGERLSPHALWFPPDELYDVGLREAVQAVALRAGPGARLMTEAPAVVSFYAVAYGRSDLRVQRLSGTEPVARDWVLVQDSRIYLENRAVVARARQGAPVLRVWAERFSAVEVYRW